MFSSRQWLTLSVRITWERLRAQKIFIKECGENNMNDKEIIEELVSMLTTDYWNLFTKNDQKIIERKLKEMKL
jgi:hypothetical protein